MVNKIFFLILTTCFLLPTSTFAHGDAHSELIIRMTESGFEPKELTITESDEVIFINNDDTDRWPASNFHPTHTLYPEFDPQKHITPGESWKFTFKKAGIWRMHDHLIPHMTGTIVVLPDPETEGRTLEEPGFWAKLKNFFLKLFSGSKTSTIEFKKLNEKEKYAKLKEVSAREGPEAAWQLVLDTYNTPEGVIGSPHDMAHLVGQLIFKEYGFEGLTICKPIFAFGCYHGLMEVAFDKNSDKDYFKNLSAAEEGCKALEKETQSYHSCLHGIGHGIATFRDYNLTPSLSDCGTFEESVGTYCYDGIFMEFSLNAPANFYTKEDPIYPCNAVGEKPKIACARSQTQVMRLKLELDTQEIADTCRQNGDKDILYHCIDALGYFVAQNAYGNSYKIIFGCEEIKEEGLAAQCMEAAAGELIFQNTVGWQKAVLHICGSLAGEFRKACEERVEQVKKSYGRS